MKKEEPIKLEYRRVLVQSGGRGNIPKALIRTREFVENHALGAAQDAGLMSPRRISRAIEDLRNHVLVWERLPSLAKGKRATKVKAYASVSLRPMEVYLRSGPSGMEVESLYMHEMVHVLFPYKLPGLRDKSRWTYHHADFCRGLAYVTAMRGKKWYEYAIKNEYSLVSNWMKNHMDEYQMLWKKVDDDES